MMESSPEWTSAELKSTVFSIVDFRINFTEIIGLSGLKVDIHGKTVSHHPQFDQLVRPHQRLSPGASRYFELNHEQLERAPPLRDVLPLFRKWLDETVLVSKSSAFDFYALSRTADEQRLEPVHNPVIDPFYMAFNLHPRSWQKVLEPLHPRGKSLPINEKLKLLSEVSMPLVREFVRRGDSTVGDILPFSCPKPLSRAYTFLHQVLHDAYMRRLSVLIEYPRQSGGGPDSQKAFDRRKVDIFGFRLPFFVGFCHMRKAMRTFRLERIRRFQLLPESGYTIRPDFDLGSYFMNFDPGSREADLTTNIHFR